MTHPMQSFFNDIAKAQDFKPRDRKCVECGCLWHSEAFDCCPRCDTNGRFRAGVPLDPQDDYRPVMPGRETV